MLDDLVVRIFQLVPLCAVLLILLASVVFVLRLLRAHLSKTELRPINYLESFQKLHEEGELTQEEFRLVRRLLSLQLTKGTDEQKPDFSLLNKSSPSPPADYSSGNTPKN